MKTHPLANLFPMATEEELRDMAADIKKHGIRQAIVTHEEMILDGRNRFRACQIARVNPIFTSYKGDDPLAYVLSANLHRRHLTTSQRAEIAARLANHPGGEPSQIWLGSPPEINPALTNSRAAKALSVSEHSVRLAKKMLAVATPKEVADVKTGKKTVNAVLKSHEENNAPTELVLRDYTELAREVPAEIADLWRAADTVADEILSHLRQVKKIMKDGISNREENLIWIDSTNTDGSGVEQVIGHVNLNVKPHAVCSHCHGQSPRKNCKFCRGRGFIGRHLWTTCVDQKTKDMLRKLK